MPKLLAFGLAVVVVSGCQSEQEPSRPRPWQEEYHLEIAKTLAAKHITGCGQFRYRENSKSTGGEYNARETVRSGLPI